MGASRSATLIGTPSVEAIKEREITIIHTLKGWFDYIQEGLITYNEIPTTTLELHSTQDK